MSWVPLFSNRTGATKEPRRNTVDHWEHRCRLVATRNSAVSIYTWHCLFCLASVVFLSISIVRIEQVIFAWKSVLESPQELIKTSSVHHGSLVIYPSLIPA